MNPALVGAKADCSLTGLHRNLWYNRPLNYTSNSLEGVFHVKETAYGIYARRDVGHYGNTLHDIGISTSKGWNTNKLEIRTGLDLKLRFDALNANEKFIQNGFSNDHLSGRVPFVGLVNAFPEPTKTLVFGLGASIAHNGVLLGASTQLPSWYVEEAKYKFLAPPFNLRLAYRKAFNQLALAGQLTARNWLANEELLLDVAAQYKAIKLGAAVNDRFVFHQAGSESLFAMYNRKLAINTGLQLKKVGLQISWINIVREDIPGNTYEISFAYFFSGRDNSSETAKILNTLF